MKTINNSTKSLIGKLAVLLVSVVSVNAKGQTTMGISPGQIMPPIYPYGVELQGSYVYESKSIRFFLNLSPDHVAYPSESQVSTNTDICGAVAKGEFCQPIAISPPPPKPMITDRYIAHLQTSNCWGWAPARTKDLPTNGFNKAGLIRFSKFRIHKNLGIVSAETVAVESDELLEQSIQGEISNLKIDPKINCRDAHRAARVLERTMEYSVTKEGLHLKLRSGRVLKLKKVYVMPLPGVAAPQQ